MHACIQFERGQVKLVKQEMRGVFSVMCRPKAILGGKIQLPKICSRENDFKVDIIKKHVM